MFPCETLVLDPGFTISGGISTTDEYCGHHGGVGICYESGLAHDLTSTDAVLGYVLALLQAELGLELDGDGLDRTPCRSAAVAENNKCYEMFEAVYLSEGGFEFAEGMGAHNFQHVPAGAAVGHHKAEGGVSQAVTCMDHDRYLQGCVASRQAHCLALQATGCPTVASG
jgi:hypothetical protein